jgi:hypothetical protein
MDRAVDTDEEKHLRDPEDRLIDEYSSEQRKDKEMDKTLADSFPASDPPAWQPLNRGMLQKGTIYGGNT